LTVVKTMNLNSVRWLVTVVVTYTGVSLLRTAAREKAVSDAAKAGENRPAAT
jgi:hypothetical protein